MKEHELTRMGINMAAKDIMFAVYPGVGLNVTGVDGKRPFTPKTRSGLINAVERLLDEIKKDALLADDVEAYVRITDGLGREVAPPKLDIEKNLQERAERDWYEFPE